MKADIVLFSYELVWLCEDVLTTFCFPFVCFSLRIGEIIMNSKRKSISDQVEVSVCNPIGIIRFPNKPIDFLISTGGKKLFMGWLLRGKISD